MARIIRPNDADSSQYRGLDWIFEYTNQDGALTTWNCGQAAAATFLTHHGRMDPLHAAGNMSWLEQHHPPDQLGGWLGTGRRRVERALRAFDLEVVEVEGEVGLKRELDRRNPVILMVHLSPGKLLGFDLPGGHWMVAYGYDERAVHLTNGCPLSWAELAAAWDGIASRWIRMNGRGLALRGNG